MMMVPGQPMPMGMPAMGMPVMINPMMPQMGMPMQAPQQVLGLAPDEFLLKLHPHPLKRQTLGELRKTCGGHSTVNCKGSGFYGCRTWGKNKDIERRDPNDTLYHCADCEYDLCEKCYNFYGNHPHGHPL